MFGVAVVEGLKAFQGTYTTSATIVVPAYVTNLKHVVVMAPGGKGGASSGNYWGGGAGGGETCYVQNVAVTPGTTLTLTLNANGSAPDDVTFGHPTLGDLTALHGANGGDATDTVTSGAGGAGGGTGGGAGGTGVSSPGNGVAGSNGAAAGSDIATWAGYTIARHFGAGGGSGAVGTSASHNGGAGGDVPAATGVDGWDGGNAATNGYGGGGGGGLGITGVTGPHTTIFEAFGGNGDDDPLHGYTGVIYLEW